MNKILLSKAIGVAKTVIAQDINDINYKLLVIKAIANNDINEIKDIKDEISPNCKSCLNPCGRTSDFDFSHLDEIDNYTKEAKLKLLEILMEASKYINSNSNIDTINQFIKCLFFINEYVDEDYILKLSNEFVSFILNEFNERDYKCKVTLKVKDESMEINNTKKFISLILSESHVTLDQGSLLFKKIIEYTK